MLNQIIEKSITHIRNEVWRKNLTEKLNQTTIVYAVCGKEFKSYGIV